MLDIKPVHIGCNTWDFTWEFDRQRPESKLWIRAVNELEQEILFPVYDIMHLTPCAIRDICHEKVREFVDGNI